MPISITSANFQLICVLPDAEESERREKLIRLAELDRKVKEAEVKLETLETEKAELFGELKQVLAVEAKARQEEQRLMQQKYDLVAKISSSRFFFFFFFC